MRARCDHRAKIDHTYILHLLTLKGQNDLFTRTIYYGGGGNFHLPPKSRACNSTLVVTVLFSISKVTFSSASAMFLIL